ncbi:MAG: DMT family transporter [Verrucomicrobiaceae bacterium]|nr:DMT family transporter [Verrucomicrobiaceae bacterium]
MPASLALLAFPLSAALLYAFGAMVLKRSSDLGVGVWRTTFVVNLIVAGCFSLLWLLGGPPVKIEWLWQPALIALCLFVGQLTQFVALDKGDVSVVVPVFGLKVVIVALFTPMIVGEPVPAIMGLAALLSVAGVTFLNRKDHNTAARSMATAITAGCGGAVAFALFDMLVQKWGPAWGAGRLLPCIFWMNAILSFGLVLQFRAPLSAIPAQGWKWLLGGSILLGTQSILFVSFLAIYGKATAANVIYSSRGLLSVILVWTIGHWFANAEQGLGAKVLRWRLIGALMMLAAIIIVITQK